MTLTQETAEKCETALKMAVWIPRTGCPTCGKLAGDPQHRLECPIGIALAALQGETPEQPRPDTPEHKAHELFARLMSQTYAQERDEPETVEDKTLRELADLIASHERLVEALNQTPYFRASGTSIDDHTKWWTQYSKPALDNAWKPD